MTIVDLKKITLFAPTHEKAAILDNLQSLGCLHIIPLTQQDNILDKRSPFSDTREALKHLQTSPTKLKTHTEIEFDPAEIERRALQNKREIENLTLESDALKKKIEDLKPWGNFVLPDPKEIGNQRFWFYLIPHHEIKKLKLARISHKFSGKSHTLATDLAPQICEAVLPEHYPHLSEEKSQSPKVRLSPKICEKCGLDSLCLKQIHQDHRYCYVVIVSQEAPKEIPGIRVMLDKEPLDHLKKRLEQIEIRLEDLALERIQLTRSLDYFEKNLHKLEDQDQLKSVLDQTLDQKPVFALQAWIPIADVEKVLSYVKEKKIAALVTNPSPDEAPPTLLKNRPIAKSGEDLLSFYLTPSYWLWDPSSALFFSFAIFFAMILSDAGYSLILGCILAFFWKKMGQTASKKRFRTLLVALTLFSFVWGVLVGSYFGITPHPSSLMGKLKVIDMQNYSAMMALVIGVGTMHIMIANLALAFSLRKSSKAWAHIGWILALAGAACAFFGYQWMGTQSPLKIIGFWMIGLGLCLVILFSSTEKNPWKRILGGLTGLARITGIFGDVLSYLRLFALGLASASLATVFNHLAKQVYLASPTFKVIFFLLIILIGHGINFMLSMMSGFIHGLRLNFIEFFNWSLPDEGVPFRAFVKKEESTWNQ